MASLDRFGVPTLALAVLAIVLGVLILVFPFLVGWLVGIGLIVAGVVWLVTSFGGAGLASPGYRRRAAPPRF